MEITLSGSEGTYQIDSIGTISGRYLGTFKFKTYLTPIDLVNSDREFRNLIGTNQVNVDPTVEFLAFALTQLKYRIISAPFFWQSESGIGGGNIPDRNIIEEIFEAAMLTEKKYRENILSKHSESIKKMEIQLNKEKQDVAINKEFEQKPKTKNGSKK